MKRPFFAALLVSGLSALPAHAVTVIPLADRGGRAGFQINGQNSDDWLGLPVAGIGDFNGDGIDDLLVAAERGNPGTGGATYLIFGRGTPFPPVFDLGTLDGTSGLRIDSALPWGNEFDASGAGDFNDDGYADVIMGMPDFDNLRGKACVIFGGPSHPAVLSLSQVNGANGTCFEGVTQFDNIGKVAVSVGDVNADGIADVAIGSMTVDGRAVDDGGIYVVFGRSGPFPATQSLGGINGTNGFLFTGRLPGDRLGISAAPAGDVNGDGRDDMLIGSENEQSRRGAAHVLFGRSTPWPAKLSPADIDGSIGFSLAGANLFDGLGRGVGALDFDGDGFSDVAAGTTFGGIGNDNGSGSIVYGHPGPFPATTDVATLDGVIGRAFFGSTLFERLGEQSGSAGDINGDGIDDLMLTAPFADFGGPDAGSMFIVFGRPQRGPAQVFSSDIPGRIGFRMDGFDPDGYCGQRQRRIGDINADGIDDLVVGCNYSSGGGFHRGSAHVIFGDAAPKARRASAIAASVADGDVAAIFAIATVAASQYVDLQPFAGAAITQTPSDAAGHWSFRQSDTGPFQPIPVGLGKANALVLSPDAQIRFSPVVEGVGSAQISLRFWDGGGGYAAGLANIEQDIGSLGGFADDANVHDAVVFHGGLTFRDGFE